MDSVFLGAMLNQIDDETTITQHSGEGTNESDGDNLSDERSNSELDVSAFQVDDDEDENGSSSSHELVDSKTERNFMGGEHTWNCWEDIVKDVFRTIIAIPKMMQLTLYFYVI